MPTISRGGQRQYERVAFEDWIEKDRGGATKGDDLSGHAASPAVSMRHTQAPEGSRTCFDASAGLNPAQSRTLPMVVEPMRPVREDADLERFRRGKSGHRKARPGRWPAEVAIAAL